MSKLVKKTILAMSTEELNKAMAEQQLVVEAASNEKSVNIAKGNIGMIEVELATRNRNIDTDANGNTEESVTIQLTPEEVANWTLDQCKEALALSKQLVEQNSSDVVSGYNVKLLEDAIFEKEPARTLPPKSDFEIKAELELKDIIYAITTDDSLDINTKWCRILKAASTRADETKLPHSEASDSELLRRLKLVWSKKAIAKKAANEDDFMAASAEEELINSYRTNKRASSTTGTVASDATAEQMAKMSQEDLRKLIRNFQSKKSTAKKAGDSAMEAAWQLKVEEAQKCLKDAPDASKQSKEIIEQSKGLLESLKPLAGTSEEIDNYIAKLEAIINDK